MQWAKLAALHNSFQVRFAGGGCDEDDLDQVRNGRDGREDLFHDLGIDIGKGYHMAALPSLVSIGWAVAAGLPGLGLHDVASPMCKVEGTNIQRI
jgi:hypothetical protein